MAALLAAALAEAALRDGATAQRARPALLVGVVRVFEGVRLVPGVPLRLDHGELRPLHPALPDNRAVPWPRRRRQAPASATESGA